MSYYHMQVQAVEAAVHAVGSSYSRLVLLVGQHGEGKTTLVQSIAPALNADVVNVGLLLSQRLLEFPVRQRPVVVSRLVDEMLKDTREVVMLDNLELLFDVSLQLDPLKLLQNLAKHRTIVAAWSGRVKNGQIVYAEVGHPEYRNYHLHDTVYISLDADANMVST